MKRKIPVHMEGAILNGYKQLMVECLYLNHAVGLIDPVAGQEAEIKLANERAESVTNMVLNGKRTLQSIGAM